MGPYTGEEHVKRRLVVREACLNHTYVDPTVYLVERPDLDKGRRKRGRVREECNGAELITAMPLHDVGFGGAGGPSCAWMRRSG